MPRDTCALARSNVHVLGIDWDTHLFAFTLLDSNKEVCSYGVHKVPGKSASDRFPLLMADWRRELERSFFVSDGLIIVIEDAPYVVHRGAYGGLAQVLGGLRALAFTATSDVGVPIATMVHLVRGSSWKKALGMSGNANKAAISEWVENNCPISDIRDGSQDLKDSYGIARYGLTTFG